MQMPKGRYSSLYPNSDANEEQKLLASELLKYLLKFRDTIPLKPLDIKVKLSLRYKKPSAKKATKMSKGGIFYACFSLANKTLWQGAEWENDCKIFIRIHASNVRQLPNERTVITQLLSQYFLTHIDQCFIEPSQKQATEILHLFKNLLIRHFLCGEVVKSCILEHSFASEAAKSFIIKHFALFKNPTLKI